MEKPLRDIVITTVVRKEHPGIKVIPTGLTTRLDNKEIQTVIRVAFQGSPYTKETIHDVEESVIAGHGQQSGKKYGINIWEREPVARTTTVLNSKKNQ